MATLSETSKPINEQGGYDEVRALGGGAVEYRLNGELHRIDGPAVITREGDEHWYLNGKRHRIGGPAIITRNGAEQHWISGIRAEYL